MIPVLAVTVGDMNGIGPEVALKGVRRYRGKARPLLVGPPSVFEYYARKSRLPVRLESTRHTDDLREFVRRAWSHHRVPVVDLPSPDGELTPAPGVLSLSAGRTAGQAITLAVDLVLQGSADAVVTAPVAKSALHKAGFPWPGQTEMIQHLSHSERVAMMLVCRALRIGLVTIHVPINEVAPLITASLLRERILTISNALRSDWRVRKPRIAILGLNPHAGERGELGNEEGNILVPVLQRLREERNDIDGPFPADGFFARYKPGTYDVVIAMYHDQGLIPLKMLARGHGVNVSVGLPIVRTSPDHGTAFDIAGANVADPASMHEALLLAEAIVLNRNKGKP